MQNFLRYYTSLKSRWDKLMEGRHGFDAMSGDSMILWVIVGFINSFIRSRLVSLAALIFPAFAAFRMLSTKTVKREAENRKYLSFRKSAAEFFKITYKKVKEHKTHRYYKCKNCSSYLRVRRKKGKHTVVCPKCGKEIHVTIR